MNTLTLTGALRQARATCDRTCFPYHSTWRLHRRVGLKGHPGWHTPFYARALAHTGLADRARLRALVCGTSDEQMTATLTALVGTHRLDIHLVDRCPTPLALARAYADRERLTLTTHLATAPDLPTFEEPFDLVVTDGLLSLLPTPDAVERTIDALADALRPDGALLYTARVTRPPRTTLEYDRVGRWIQTAVTLGAWPRPWRERHAAARVHRSRPSRTTPYTTPESVRSAFTGAFTHVRADIEARPATWAQRLHPAHLHGTTSLRVGVTATAPASTKERP